MKRRSPNKIYIPILLILFLIFSSCTSNKSEEYIFEIMGENGAIHEKIILNQNDFKQIGLDEKRGSIFGVEISISNQYSDNLRDLSAKHIGKRLKIRRDRNTLISAIIREPIENGKLFVGFQNKKEALAFISSFERKPDFHLQYTKKELEEAEAYLKPARNPFFKKSLEALHQKDYATAEENAIQAIDSEPNEPSHYHYLGYIYHEMKKPDLEVEQYLKAKSMLGPTRKMPGLFLSLGQFYIESGDYNSAIETYEEYLSKYGVYFLINASLANVYEKKGDFDSALNQYSLLARSGNTHFENIGIEGIKRLKEHNKGINSD